MNNVCDNRQASNDERFGEINKNIFEVYEILRFYMLHVGS